MLEFNVRDQYLTMATDDRCLAGLKMGDSHFDFGFLDPQKLSYCGQILVIQTCIRVIKSLSFKCFQAGDR